MRVMFMHIPGVKPVQEIIPFETEVNGSTTYKRFTDGYDVNPRTLVKTPAKEFIFRTTVSGNTTRQEKAWDLWSNRATATYVPINNPMDGAPCYGSIG